MNQPQIDLSLVIPLFNEKDNVRKVTNSLVDVLQKESIRFEIVLVDNGSWDGTGEEIDQLINTFGSRVTKQVVTVNQGYGWGVRRGLELCKGKYVGFMVGDGQVKARDVVRTYGVIKGKTRILAKGCRWKRDDGAFRTVLSLVYNQIARLLYGSNVKDVNGGPKIYAKELTALLDLQSKGSFLDCEILTKAKMLGFQIVEVPIISLRRATGTSRDLKLRTILIMMKDLVAFRFSSRLAAWKEQLYSKSDPMIVSAGLPHLRESSWP